MDDYRERESELADDVIDLVKAFAAFEGFGEKEEAFADLGKKVRGLSHSFERLSMARRKMQENLAKSAERR